MKVPNPKDINEIRSLIKEHQLDLESDSKNRQLLIEGFENIKHRILYNQKLAEAGGPALDINNISGGWISNLVRDTIGGKINCVNLTVEWVINNKIIIFNPFNGLIEHADKS